MIKLYTIGCSRCKVLEKKLQQLGKEFELVEDIDEINKFAEEHDFHSAPILVVDDQLYDFVQANRIIAGL